MWFFVGVTSFSILNHSHSMAVWWGTSVNLPEGQNIEYKNEGFRLTTPTLPSYVVPMMPSCLPLLTFVTSSYQSLNVQWSAVQHRNSSACGWLAVGFRCYYTVTTCSLSTPFQSALPDNQCYCCKLLFVPELQVGRKMSWSSPWGGSGKAISLWCNVCVRSRLNANEYE